MDWSEQSFEAKREECIRRWFAFMSQEGAPVVKLAWHAHWIKRTTDIDQLQKLLFRLCEAATKGQWL